MFGSKKPLTIEERELIRAQAVLALCQAASLGQQSLLINSVATPIYGKAVALSQQVIL